MTEQQPPYEVGQIVNGHRWTGEIWEPVEAAAPMPPAPQPGDDPTTTKKPWFKKWWGIAGIVVAALFVVTAVASCGDDSANTTSEGDQTSASASPSDEATQESTEEPTEEATQEPTEAAAPSFSGDGIFEVGAEIKAGLYVSEGSGYWERLSGATGEYPDIIANGNANGMPWIRRGSPHMTYVQIQKSDAFFSTNGMADWVLVKPATATGEKATEFSGDGMYMVGVDIKPGTYKAKGRSASHLGILVDGYWERLRGATGEFDDIIANGNANANGNAVVEIKSSDKFFSTNGMDIWTRTS